MNFSRAASIGFAVATLAGLTGFASPAKADWDRYHHWHGHWYPGWGPPPVYYAPPPVYYAPPPRVYYAPPPVVYAPPPAYYPPVVSFGVRIR